MSIVKGCQKAPFSIATTLRCRGGRYSFLWIAPLYPCYIPYIAECCHFLSLWYDSTWDWIQSPRQLVNTRPSGLSVCQWSGRPGSIPDWVIPKTQKMALDADLLNIHHYKGKDQVGQSLERSCALPQTLV